MFPRFFVTLRPKRSFLILHSTPVAGRGGGTVQRSPGIAAAVRAWFTKNLLIDPGWLLVTTHGPDPGWLGPRAS